MEKEPGSIDILIIGPGGIINFEVEYIAKCLRDVGYNVVIDNPHADWTGDNTPRAANWLADLTERKKLVPTQEKIYLKANHLPWGG